MRLLFWLFIALAVAVGLILFPNIADQTIRFEAFGWIFESRQGAFIVAVMVLLFVLALLRAMVRALLAGPGSAWRSMRVGSLRRRERRLREGLAQWVDMRGDNGARLLRRASGVLPDWAMAMLKTLSVEARDQSPERNGEDALVTALAARIATDPAAVHKPDLAARKAHLESWLHVHPGAPLALSRMADLAEEEQQWARVAELLEAQWNQGQRSSHTLKPRLAHAYLQLAVSDSDYAMAHLRKAYRLMPESEAVVQAYGGALVNSGEAKTAIRIWQGWLQSHDDMVIARKLLPLLKEDAMRAYRKLEGGRDAASPAAQRWLRAELAHAAKLDGLAVEQMQALAESEQMAAAWQSLGDWYAAGGDSAAAMRCFRQALACGL